MRRFHLDCIGAASFDDVAIVNEAGDYEYECEFCARDGSDIFDASTDDGDDETGMCIGALAVMR